MAYFYGGVRGSSSTEATRTGTKASGMSSRILSESYISTTEMFRASSRATDVLVFKLRQRGTNKLIYSIEFDLTEDGVTTNVIKS